MGALCCPPAFSLWLLGGCVAAFAGALVACPFRTEDLESRGKVWQGCGAHGFGPKPLNLWAPVAAPHPQKPYRCTASRYCDCCNQWLCAGGFVTCRLQTLAQRAEGVNEVGLLVVAPGLLHEDGLAPCSSGLSDDVPVVVHDVVGSGLLPRSRAEAVQQLGLTSSIDPFKALIKGGYSNAGPPLE